MVAYTKHQQSKKEESKKLRGERDQIKFIASHVSGFDAMKVGWGVTAVVRLGVPNQFPRSFGKSMKSLGRRRLHL